MLKKIMVVLCLCMVCFAGTALADAPDPSGRPRKRPWQEQPEFIIERVVFLGNGIPDQLGAEIFYEVPVPAEVVYRLNDENGGQLRWGKSPTEGGHDSFTISLPAPEDGMTRRELKLNVYYKSDKCLTPYGMKNYGRSYKSDDANITFVVEIIDGVCKVGTL